MTIQKIEKSIEINAPKHKVWQVLFDRKFIPEWYTAFGQGIMADTDWQLGSTAVFTDEKGNGIIGKIIENFPDEKLIIEYNGIVKNGQQDFESDEAKGINGSQETYTLQSTRNGTKLLITCDMDDTYFEMMSAAWVQALEKIKLLSETSLQ